MGSAMFPGGNGNYRLETYVTVSGRTIEQVFGVRRLGGSGFYNYDPQPWSVSLAGVPDWGSWTYDYTGGVTWREIGRHTVGNVPYGTHNVVATVTMDFGPGYGGRQTISVTDVVTIIDVPAAPNPIGWENSVRSVCNLGYRYSRGDGRGSGIIQDQVQWSTRPDFATVAWDDFGANTYSSPQCGAVPGAPALTAGTTYYVRARSRNGVGWGPWSGALSAATLPAGAPGMTVQPSPDGTRAQYQLTPPGGTSGVTSYDVEYRPTGSTSATSFSSSSATGVVSGLTVGSSYEWRARAKYGTSYTSPWSTWLTVIQTPPTADPSAYFDGSQGGQGNRIFSWAGTPHASVSQAGTATPVGWEATTLGGGSVALGQIVGGLFGKYAARALVTADLTGAGLEVGLDNVLASTSLILGGEPYAATIYARPSRAQRIAAIVYWFASDMTPLGSSVGGAIVADPDDGFQRLDVIGIAPPTAARAIVRARDVSGTGWSAFLAGEYLDADSAMISLRHIYDYFDGSFLGTPEYSFDWDGADNASPSTRYFNPEQVYVIADPDCAAIPNAPRPPAIPNDCIVTIGQWRRFWFAIPASEVGEWSDTLPTIRIRTAGTDVGQVRVRFYRNPDGTPAEMFDATVWDGELILSYVPPNAVVTLDGISERATADVAGRTGVPADHLLYGSEGVVTWPVLSCGDSYLMSWDIPTTTPAGNVAVELDLTQRM